MPDNYVKRFLDFKKALRDLISISILEDITGELKLLGDYFEIANERKKMDLNSGIQLEKNTVIEKFLNTIRILHDGGILNSLLNYFTNKGFEFCYNDEKVFFI